MAFRRYVKEFFHKFRDWFKLKGRMKKKITDCYWPEFYKYCGCCDISIGIYIRSLITLTISAITLYINGTILNNLFRIGSIINSANLTDIENYNATDRDEPERDLATLQLIYNCLVMYYIIWISFRVLYVVTVMFTAFAVYRKISWMLKVLLYISVPNWVFDFIITMLGAVMVPNFLKVILLVLNISEAYNILAINSEYKRMRGKSRIAAEDIECEASNDEICVNNFITLQRERYHNGYTQIHCRSCTCNENTMNINSNQFRPGYVISTEPTYSAASINENSNSNPLNAIADNNPTENTSDNAARAESSLREVNSSGEVHVRPTTIDLKPKEDISDTPIIYDEQQLNVGSSPVVEDRCFLPND